MRTRRIAGLACLALLVLAGCRDRSTAQDKQDKLCEELAKVDGTVTQIAALEPSAANVSRLRELRTRLEAQFREVEKAAEDATAVPIDNIRQSYQNVLRATSGVNDQSTLAQAEPQIDQAAGEFSDARLNVHTSSGC